MLVSHSRMYSGRRQTCGQGACLKQSLCISPSRFADADALTNCQCKTVAVHSEPWQTFETRSYLTKQEVCSSFCLAEHVFASRQVDSYEEKQKELESIVNPIFAKLYAGGGEQMQVTVQHTPVVRQCTVQCCRCIPVRAFERIGNICVPDCCVCFLGGS